MVYVHVPFCRSFCTYCGFYSEICSRKVPQQVQNRIFSAYTDAILDEIFDRADFFGRGIAPKTRALRRAKALLLGSQASECLLDSPRDLGNVRGRGPSLAMGGAERSEAVGGTMTPAKDPTTLYFGGGTPSVLPVETLERIVQALGPADYEEFTIEVNPDDITEKGIEYVRRLVSLGVTRVSMGVQSFDDGILRWMNRRHSAAQAREAFRLLREGGVPNISIDLIFGLTQLTDRQWEDSIAEALALCPEHISAYQLSVERGSALERLIQNGRYAEASEELCRRQYDVLCDRLAAAGYHHYEVSNWALPGREAVHNSAYWRRVSYIGLGPGAHSFDAEAGVRSWNSEELAHYDSDGSLRRWHSESETLTAAEAAEERIMLALRTAAGMPEDELRSCTAVLGHDRSSVDRLLEEGVLVRQEDHIRIPEDRFFVSDDIISSLI